MLRVRPEQLADLEKGMRESFLERTAQSLRETMPSKVVRLSDTELLDLLKECAENAAHYGIVSNRGVFQYAILRLLAGPRFDEAPETSHYLNLPHIDPTEKIAALLDSVLNSLRKSI